MKLIKDNEVSRSLKILEKSIQEIAPQTIICLYSGGYDSAISTHISQGRALRVYSINTMLSADGWEHYVKSVANSMNWDHAIYRNYKGFSQFRKWVSEHGCPYSRTGHSRAYHRLKERALEAIHKQYKMSWKGKTLFISGMRRSESPQRSDLPEFSRKGKSNIYFVAPILYWTDDMCNRYRIENGLPDNPFYSTVSGSGDCQCNWGNFIDLKTLKKYSPELANGNVAMIDQLSRQAKGYGWDEGSTPIKDNDHVDLGLCQGCSRTKNKPSNELVERRILQDGI